MIVTIAVMLVLLGLLLLWENRSDNTGSSTEITEATTETAAESNSGADGDETVTESKPDADDNETVTESKPDTDDKETVTESKPDADGDEAVTESKPDTDDDEAVTESKPDADGNEINRDELYYRYSELELKKLSGTNIFTKSAIEHIFKGNNASGYHYEGIKDTPGRADPETRSDPDDSGVYTARVTVNGKNKKGNKGYSSFFPVELSPQEVVDAISEAYNGREHVNGNTYEGVSEGGIVIDMYLTDDGKIISAFPIYDK